MALRIAALPSLDDALAQVDTALATPLPTLPIAQPVAAPPSTISPEVADYARRRAGLLGAPVPARPTEPAPGVTVAPMRQATDDERPPAFARRAPAAEGPAADPEYVPKWKRLLGGLFGGMRGSEMEDRARARYERDLAKRTEDPGSVESKAAQSSWAPYLRAGGWTDDEIGRMSAAQLRQINVSGIVGARQERLQKEAEAARKAEAERVALEAQRQADEEVWKAHNATTSEQAMDRTRVLAGIGAQRMSQAERDRIEAEARAEERRLAAEDRAEQRRIEQEKRTAAAQGKPDPDTYRIPGTEISDPQRFRQVIADDTQRRKMEDEVKANDVIRQGLRQMQAILDKYGTTNDNPEVIAAYDSARNLVYGGMTVLGKTGALQEADLPRYRSSLPDITLSREDAYRLIPGGSKNPKADALRGFQSTIEGIIDASLQSSGIRMSKGDGAPQPGQGGRPRAAAPRGAAPAAQPPKPGMKRVRVGKRTVWLTPEGLQQMIDDGISAEVVE